MLNCIKYRPEFLDDLREVCLNTAYSTAHEPKERKYLLNSYCDYYLEQDGAHCYAAVDENNRAQGYVLCAHDVKAYLRDSKPYFKRAVSTGFSHAVEAVGERALLVLFGKAYPAHMHADLNPGFQGQGAGSKMMQMLISQLREEKVKGLMLTVGSGNTDAQRFYARNGLKVIVKLGPATVMGTKF